MASLTKKESKQEKYGITWQLDADVQECNECRKTFNAFRRKHHCRNCGMIFCNDCTSNKMTVRGSSNLKRVCVPCKAILDAMVSTPNPLDDPSTSTSSKSSTNMNRGNTRGSKVPEKDQEPLLNGVVLRWANELMDGSNVTCHFYGTMIMSGFAVWYRSIDDADAAPAGGGGAAAAAASSSSSSRVEIDRQRLTWTRDATYVAKQSDIGHYLTCVVEASGVDSAETTSDKVVLRAQPGLQSVNIGLRPHVHTLRCDRSERVCDAIGKYREGETLYMTLNTKGMDDTNPSEVKCSYRWLKSTVPVSAASAASSSQRRSSKKKDKKHAADTAAAAAAAAVAVDTTPTTLLDQQQRKRGSQTFTRATVLFDFEAIETNEMSVLKGDVLTDVEVVDADWCRGSFNGKRGAIPTAYIQLNAEDKVVVVEVGTETETKCVRSGEINGEEDTSDDDDDDMLVAAKVRTRWRGSIFDMCEWIEISTKSGTTTCDQAAELPLGLDNVGYMIALEVTLEDLPEGSNVVQVHKRSLPVGPIEAANCRIDNLIISSKEEGVGVGKVVKAVYDYYGGHEGASTFSWIRITPQGQREEITNTSPRDPKQPGIRGPESYTLTERDMGCRLKVHVRVLRDDGLTVSFFFQSFFCICQFLLRTVCVRTVVSDLVH